ncbi:hypothetical protein [Bifidobacterium simiarum]|uniref:hypothetical protein n=1 Tax=Bifidobacterium simiarum TaxID=2045441 RepID=UPI001BDD1787|nr:hypothetical protein [Bifidobacterium simiarum]MBT1167011.1 hypothetical protein [Bifidobacterium simiarum]
MNETRHTTDLPEPPALAGITAAEWPMTINAEKEPLDSYRIVLLTRQPDLYAEFEIDVFPSGRPRNYLDFSALDTTQGDWTTAEILDLADSCDRLQQWLDSCAAALQWAQEHADQLRP